jgi:hypothetical protein
MIQANFTVLPSSGDVFATEFAITNFTTTTGSTVSRYVWNLGNNNFIYNTKNPTFSYNYPGIYNITLSAIDFDNNLSTFNQQITATLPYRDYITFTQIPETYPDPGKITKTPFKISVLTSNYNSPLVVDLFATNSQSTPTQFIPSKWNFLNPTWKFLDKNLNTVTTLSVEPIPVYKNNKIVAVSGTAEFYYIDSNSTGDPRVNPPILITATLQTNNFSNALDSNVYNYNSYANTDSVQAGIIWQVNDLFPNLLKITGNYIDEINPRQWVGIKIPLLITCHSQQSYFLPSAESTPSEIIFTYPENNSIGNTSSVQLSVKNLAPNQYFFEKQPLYFQAKDKEDNRVGGYLFTGVTILTAVDDIAITANTEARSTKSVNNKNTFIYPYGYSINPGVWVSNPLKNSLNKITLTPYSNNSETINIFKQNKTLLDGAIKEVIVPGLSSTETYNYSMSGFSGIYSISVDPRNGDIIACDTEFDRLYRISTTGEILNSFELSGLEGYNPKQKFFASWSWVTPSPFLSSTNYAMYGPYLVNKGSQNYLTTINGLLLPPNLISIEPYERWHRLLYRLYDLPYPEGDMPVETTQILTPTLVKKYSNNFHFWTGKTVYPTTSIYLTGINSLLKDSNKFLVSLNGLLQSPTTYVINPYLRTVNFNTPLNKGTEYDIRYIPDFNRVNWSFTSSNILSSFSCKNQINFASTDPNIGFLISINGYIQPQRTFKYNFEEKTLLFNPQISGAQNIDISQFSVPDEINNTIAYTPTYASIDNDFNIWVSLFNAVSVLKFDKDFNFLFSVAPSGIKWPKRAYTVQPTDLDYQASYYGNVIRQIDNETTVDIFTNEFFLKPPVVETDKENNCWVSYANPLCCLLAKYSQDGTLLTEIPLQPYTTPINIVVTPNNNIWVANYNGSVYEYSAIAGSLQLYDTNTSTLLSTVTGFARPSYLALDRNNNVWFTHSQRSIGFLNTNTGTLSTWLLELTGGFTSYVVPSTTVVSGVSVNLIDSPEFVENEEDEYISGLAVDVYDRVWVVDGLQNYAWVLSATPNFNDTTVRKFKIRPNVTLDYYVNYYTAGTEFLTGNYYFRSAQATGDWTGNRWFQKYALTSKLSSIAVSGTSINFNVEEFVDKNQIRKVNESFNTAEYYKSLALPEILNSNEVLFDQFLAAVVGTGMLSANEDIGQTTYEKIANFVSNHSDLETCNVKQLLSLAEKTAVAASDYAASYPSEIERFIDIASTPRAKLWGIEDRVPNVRSSIGTLLNTSTYVLTAGTKIILQNKLDNNISLIQVPMHSDGRIIYPLSQLEDNQFVPPVTTNYLFYEYIPRYSGEYIGNIIDWNSSYTTLNPTLSTSKDWLGNNGSVETAFRYLLTKNLFN